MKSDYRFVLETSLYQEGVSSVGQSHIGASASCCCKQTAATGWRGPAQKHGVVGIPTLGANKFLVREQQSCLPSGDFVFHINWATL